MALAAGSADERGPIRKQRVARDQHPEGRLSRGRHGAARGARPGRPRSGRWRARRPVRRSGGRAPRAGSRGAGGRRRWRRSRSDAGTGRTGTSNPCRSGRAAPAGSRRLAATTPRPRRRRAPVATSPNPQSAKMPPFSTKDAGRVGYSSKKVRPPSSSASRPPRAVGTCIGRSARAAPSAKRSSAGLAMEADEQARRLALRDGGCPGRIDSIGVGHRAPVEPGAVVDALLALPLQQVRSGPRRGLEPPLTLAARIALPRSQRPLNRRDLEQVVGVIQPRRRPGGLPAPCARNRCSSRCGPSLRSQLSPTCGAKEPAVLNRSATPGGPLASALGLLLCLLLDLITRLGPGLRARPRTLRESRG